MIYKIGDVYDITYPPGYSHIFTEFTGTCVYVADIAEHLLIANTVDLGVDADSLEGFDEAFQGRLEKYPNHTFKWVNVARANITLFNNIKTITQLITQLKEEIC